MTTIAETSIIAHRAEDMMIIVVGVEVRTDLVRVNVQTAHIAQKGLSDQSAATKTTNPRNLSNLNPLQFHQLIRI